MVNLRATRVADQLNYNTTMAQAAYPTSSAWPALPPPVPVRLAVLPEEQCPYLPQQLSRLRAFAAARISPEVYDQFMNAGFRRSGTMVYQPACRRCRACQSLRVPVEQFRPSKSQRRVMRRNADVSVSLDEARATDEKFELYRRYLHEWHGSDDRSRETFERFLYDSPVQTLEFCYRAGDGQLLAVGVCDLSPHVLSSVYFYFDPSQAKRSLGTYGALWELQWARQRQVRYYYLGYHVPGCAGMQYKAGFRPCEALGTDGVWRPLAGT